MKTTNLLEQHGQFAEAFKFAYKAHKGQKREFTGEDFIMHELAVAGVAYWYGADKPTLCACVLHDVVEDTKVSLDEIKKKFGDEIGFLVDGVTEIENNEEQTYEKIEKYAEKDKRVALIKLADRIHNIHDLTSYNPDGVEKTMKEYRIYYQKYSSRLVSLGKKYGYLEPVQKLEELIKCLKNFP